MKCIVHNLKTDCGTFTIEIDVETRCAKILSRGLGDTVAKVTAAIGITPCGGCKQRQAALNRLVPYGSSQ